MREKELCEFMVKYQKLKDEGLKPQVIRTRLGVTISTLNTRIRRFLKLRAEI